MEYCSMKINGEDLDDYLERKGIAKKYPQLSDAEYEAAQIRSQRELERACLYLDAQQRRRLHQNAKPRSDGKTEIVQKYERCMSKAQRRQKKIDRRK